MNCINFDRIVTVTHYTSPIKVGATVDIAFLHVKPDEESRMDAPPLSRRSRGKRLSERQSQELTCFV